MFLLYYDRLSTTQMKNPYIFELKVNKMYASHNNLISST